MSVIPLLVVCSLALAAAGVALFVYSVRQGDHEHADRLSLLPLVEDAGESASSDVPTKEFAEPEVE